MAKKWLNYAAMVLLFFAGIGVAKRDEIAGYFNPRSYRGGDRAVVLQLDEDFSSDLPPLPDVEDDGPAEPYDRPAVGPGPDDNDYSEMKEELNELREELEKVKSEKSTLQQEKEETPKHILSDVADIRDGEIFLNGVDMNADGSYGYDFTKKEHVALAYAEACRLRDVATKIKVFRRISTKEMIERAMERLVKWNEYHKNEKLLKGDESEKTKRVKSEHRKRSAIFNGFPIGYFRMCLEVRQGNFSEDDIRRIRFERYDDGAISIWGYNNNLQKRTSIGGKTVYLTPEDGEWKLSKLIN